MHDLSVLALFKGTEKFIFVYDEHSRAELLDAFRDAAADPTVGITWFDAAVLTDRAEEQFEAADRTAVTAPPDEPDTPARF
jgi:hypothetical protein